MKPGQPQVTTSQAPLRRVRPRQAERQAPPASLSALSRKVVFAGVLILTGCVFVVYMPALSAGYVRFDDTDFIEDNALLRTPEGLRDIWIRPRAYPLAGQYFPVTFTTYWLEYRVWQTRPAGYHVMNIALHAANALVFWAVLRRLSVPGAFAAALLFAVHPLHVQSVAWLAERKNVLSGLFGLLTLLAWLRYLRAPSWGSYAGTLLLFVLGLLSKTVLCVLPGLLLLLTWWRRPAMLRRVVLPSVPFFAVALAMIAMTVWRENTLLEGGPMRWGLTVADRILLASRALWFYVGKLLFPATLIPVYPRWSLAPREWWQFLFPLATLAVFAGAWLLRRRLGRGPLVAAVFFAALLAPVLGFVDFAYMGLSFVSDHFPYHASLSLLAGVVAGGARLVGRCGRWRRAVGPSLAAVLVLFLGVRTWGQSRVYKDPETFWSFVTAHNPCAVALSALGEAYYLKGDLGRAAELLERAVSLREHARTRFRLGLVMLRRADHLGAVEQFKRALHLNRTRDGIREMNAPLLMNLGSCYWSLGDYAKAAEAFRAAYELDPAMSAAREWHAIARRQAETCRSGRPPHTHPASSQTAP